MAFEQLVYFQRDSLNLIGNILNFLFNGLYKNPQNLFLALIIARISTISLFHNAQKNVLQRGLLHIVIQRVVRRSTQGKN